MQQARGKQFANHKARTTGRVEMIDVSAAVGIDTCQQRHHGRECIEVVPIDDDARCARNRDQVNGVIARAAGCQQADDGIDDGAFIDHLCKRCVLVAQMGDRHNAACRRGGERIAQRRVGCDEGGTRQVQAHDFHQQLVAIGGAIKSACARAVICAALGVEQSGTVQLALGKLLANFGFLIVGKPAGHRSGRYEDCRKMPKLQRADQ